MVNNGTFGAMTDWSGREFELDLSFLGEGNYTMEIFKDGVNASRFAEDYQRETTFVNREANPRIKLAPGGGWTAILSKRENK